MGHTEEAPYDAIHVGAAAPTVPQAVSFSDDQGHIVPLHFKTRNKYQHWKKKKKKPCLMQFCVCNRIKIAVLECLFKATVVSSCWFGPLYHHAIDSLFAPCFSPSFSTS